MSTTSSASIALVAMLGGCVVGDAPPRPSIEREPATHVTASMLLDEDEIDMCALAAELPPDDICSLVCDQPAMIAQLISDGNAGAACYDLYCGLPQDQHVVVGVCLP